MAVYICPSRRGPTPYPGINIQVGPTNGKIDYALNAGFSVSVPQTAAYPNGIKPIPGIWDPAVLKVNSKPVRARHVTDGLGKTYMFCEKRVQSDRYETGEDFGDWKGFLECDSAISTPVTNQIGAYACHRTADLAPQLDLPSTVEHDNPILYATAQYHHNIELCLSCLRFGSAHPATFGAVFCDGSVHSISYSIDLATHQALSSRAAGDSPDEKQY